jgi:hypothetical protein
VQRIKDARKKGRKVTKDKGYEEERLHGKRVQRIKGARKKGDRE